MQLKPVKIVVYGSEQPCPSCLHAPSSKETYEWLEAAIKRKYGNQPFTIDYIDIDNPSIEAEHFVELIRSGELFYPAVIVNDEIVGEGNPQLKTIFSCMEKHGCKPN